MRAVIDTIFDPVLNWLRMISTYISDLSVPLSQPIDFGRYFGHFAILGTNWITLITTICALAFIYLVAYVIVSNIGLFLKFKSMIKWW